MALVTQFKIGRKTFFYQWPASESIIDVNGNHFSCKRWPDRLSDCKINGKSVDQTTYRRRKDEWKTERHKPARKKK